LLLERAVSSIRDRAVPEATRAFNYDIVDAKGCSAARILGAAQTLPMMAERRMVLVRDIQQLAADELIKLVPYLADPSPSTVLVTTAPKVDKRLKFFATARKARQLHELSPPRNVVGWAREEADRQGVDIDQGAIKRLADVVGNDLSRLALSIEQLSLYASGRGIRADDVDELIAETREHTVFELTDAIGAADRIRAMTAVVALFDQQQSPIGVVVMLARHVRQMMMAQLALRDRVPRNELSRRLGVPPFIAEKIATQARRFSGEALEHAIGKLARADWALKGYLPATRTLGRRLAERVVMEQLVTGLLDSATESRGRVRPRG
jgi:DNA polymerase-3 subunit delta